MVNGINTSAMNSLYSLMSQSRTTKYQIPQGEGGTGGGTIDYEKLQKLMDWNQAAHNLSIQSMDLYKSSFELNKLLYLQSGFSSQPISSNTNVVTATKTSNAVTGSFDISVQQIANAFQVKSDPVLDTNTSLNLSGRFYLAGFTHTVTSGMSLVDIKNLINSENSNVIASIDSTNHLVLTSKVTGEESRFTAYDNNNTSNSEVLYENNFSSTDLSEFHNDSSTWYAADERLYAENTYGGGSSKTLIGSESFTTNRTISADMTLGVKSAGIMFAEEFNQDLGIDHYYDVVIRETGEMSIRYYGDDPGFGQNYSVDLQGNTEINLEVTTTQNNDIEVIVRDLSGNILFQTQNNLNDMAGRTVDITNKTVGMMSDGGAIVSFDNFKVVSNGDNVLESLGFLKTGNNFNEGLLDTTDWNFFNSNNVTNGETLNDNNLTTYAEFTGADKYNSYYIYHFQTPQNIENIKIDYETNANKPELIYYDENYNLIDFLYLNNGYNDVETIENVAYIEIYPIDNPSQFKINEIDFYATDSTFKNITQQPQNAIYSIDGSTQISSSSNNISYNSVDMVLKDIGSSTITVNENSTGDQSSIINNYEAIVDFFGSYNTMILTLKSNDTYIEPTLSKEITNFMYRNSSTFSSFGIYQTNDNFYNIDKTTLIQMLENESERVYDLFLSGSGIKSYFEKITKQILNDPFNYINPVPYLNSTTKSIYNQYY